MSFSFKPPARSAIRDSRHLNPEDLTDLQEALSPKAVRVAREMMGWTPHATATASTIKPKKFKHFENGKAVLSARDQMWLAATFHAAGINIFKGQGEVMIALPESEPKRMEEYADVFSGEECRQNRSLAGLSQKKLAALSTVRAPVISSFETGNGKFRVCLRQKHLLQQTLEQALTP